MTAMEKFNLVKRACDERKACQLHFRDEPIPRLIHPLGVCLTFNRGMIIVCCGPDHPVSGDDTIANLPMEDCENIRITEQGFKVWPEFLKKMDMCDDWLFHVNPSPV